MLRVIRLPLGTLAANCYLISEDVKKETLIIDPGDEADFILKIVRETQLIPKAIILTHGHFDHVAAATELKLSLKKEIWGSSKDKALFEVMPRQAKKYTGFPALPLRIDKSLKEGNKISVGRYVFSVWESPGHTPGSICLVSKSQKVAVVGDLVFKDASMGRYDFRYSNKKKIFDSLKRILSLSSDTVIYPGHGEEFALGEIKSFFSYNKKS